MTKSKRNEAVQELLAAAIEAVKQLRSRGDTAHAAVLQAAIDKARGDNGLDQR